MKLLVLTILAASLTGCGSMSKDMTTSGKPRISWVLKDTAGCKDRIGIWRGKLMYSKCFYWSQ